MNTRVYKSHISTIAHLLRDGESADDWRAASLCGWFATPDGPWLGTGSQDEYERAASLPLCDSCESR